MDVLFRKDVTVAPVGTSTQKQSLQSRIECFYSCPNQHDYVNGIEVHEKSPYVEDFLKPHQAVHLQ